jgi:hypothetical protein
MMVMVMVMVMATAICFVLGRVFHTLDIHLVPAILVRRI